MKDIAMLELQSSSKDAWQANGSYERGQERASSP